MNINRHNYEEFFILYLDNELSSADRKSVELFVQENPDLKGELDLLMQTTFTADDSLVYEGKQELMRSADNGCLTLANYEEWLLLYVDNELAAPQRAEVEHFAATHPTVQQELDLLLQTRVQPAATIVFPFKDTLYRHEEKAKVVTIRWWRIAAAAVLLGAVSLGGFYAYQSSQPEAAGGELATNEPKVKQTPVVSAKEDEPKRTATNNNSALAVTGDETEPQQAPVLPQQAIKKDLNLRDNNQQAQENTPAMAASNEKNRNNLPQPAYNPNMRQPIDETNMLADNNVPSAGALTKLKEINAGSRVTPNADAAYIQAGHTLNGETNIADAGQPEKKNNIRGFLRKITRTFEKTTNIKATDEDDRLLVGSLAIRL